MRVAQQLFNITFNECIPLDCIVELTSKCNLDCIHCYVVKSCDTLPTDFWKSVFLELRDIGCLYLTLTGGEIFLRNDIFEVISFARNLGFCVTLFTNGTLLDEEKIKTLKKLNIYELHISLYSLNEEEHNSVTGDKRSFRKTMKAIHLAVKNKLPLVIKTPLLKNNFPNYKGIVKFAKRLGVRYILDPLITPKSNHDLAPQKYRISVDNLIKFYSDGEIFVKEYLKANNNKENFICSAGRNLISISSNGLVYPCLQFPVVLGDLKKSKLKDILSDKNNLIRKLRNIQPERDFYCYKMCSYREFCLRCIGIVYLENRSIYSSTSSCCQLARVRKEVYYKKKKGALPWGTIYA
jgi:MoaA/NifB/PqqE/SkfB family radical SAM enzyme